MDVGTSGILLVPAQRVQCCCNAMSPARDTAVSENVSIGGSHINSFAQREQLEMQFSNNIGGTAVVSVQLSQASMLTSKLVMSPTLFI